MPTALDKPRHPNQTPPGVTRARQAQLLTLIAELGSTARACVAMRLNACTPWQWASKSEHFAKRLSAAKAAGEKVLLAEYEGSLDAVVLGNPDLESVCKSQYLRMFRMKRLDPAYRDNAPVQILATGPLALMSSLSEQRPALPGKPRSKRSTTDDS